MAAKSEVLTGVYVRARWTDPNGSGFGYHELDGNRTIGITTKIVDPFLSGVEYQFYGTWKRDDKGNTFMCGRDQYVQKEPVSRNGLIEYLKRYGELGLGTATRIVDTFGQRAIEMLRTDPVAVHDSLIDQFGTCFYEVGALKDRAAKLVRLARSEATRAKLCDLLLKRGFSAALIDAAISRWGVLAADRVKKDPFVLMTERFPSAGFLRCDRLYMELGLPPGRLKRQMMCLWYAIREDNNGNTWIPQDHAVRMLEQKISGAELKPEQAVQRGIRTSWLARYVDADGKAWLSTSERASAEEILASRIRCMQASHFVVDL